MKLPVPDGGGMDPVPLGGDGMKFPSPEEGGLLNVPSVDGGGIKVPIEPELP